MAVGGNTMAEPPREIAPPGLAKGDKETLFSGEAIKHGSGFAADKRAYASRATASPARSAMFSLSVWCPFTPRSGKDGTRRTGRQELHWPP